MDSPEKPGQPCLNLRQLIMLGPDIEQYIVKSKLLPFLKRGWYAGLGHTRHLIITFHDLVPVLRFCKNDGVDMFFYSVLPFLI